jgi:hypothetical protein
MTNQLKFDPAELNNFTGTEHYYRHALNRSIVYTDGAQYVAEAAGAYWLLDEIAISQHLEGLAKEQFQVWDLKVRENDTGTLTCEDGNYNVLYTKELEYTDFPKAGVTLWFENNTIYLPSER